MCGSVGVCIVRVCVFACICVYVAYMSMYMYERMLVYTSVSVRVCV